MAGAGVGRLAASLAQRSSAAKRGRPRNGSYRGLTRRKGIPEPDLSSHCRYSRSIAWSYSPSSIAGTTAYPRFAESAFAASRFARAQNSARLAGGRMAIARASSRAVLRAACASAFASSARISVQKTCWKPALGKVTPRVAANASSIVRRACAMASSWRRAR